MRAAPRPCRRWLQSSPLGRKERALRSCSLPAPEDDVPLAVATGPTGSSDGAEQAVVIWALACGALLTFGAECALGRGSVECRVAPSSGVQLPISGRAPLDGH